MTTTTIADVIRRQRDAIERERDYCRNAQSWSPESIRSKWHDELTDLLEAIDAGADDDEIVRLADEARARAKDLALEKIREHVIPMAGYLIIEWLEDDGIEVPLDATLAQLVELCRHHGVKVSPNPGRDGIEIDERDAVAYAITRDWDDEWCEVVTVPLVEQAEATR